MDLSTHLLWSGFLHARWSSCLQFVRYNDILGKLMWNISSFKMGEMCHAIKYPYS